VVLAGSGATCIQNRSHIRTLKTFYCRREPSRAEQRRWGEMGEAKRTPSGRSGSYLSLSHSRRNPPFPPIISSSYSSRFAWCVVIVCLSSACPPPKAKDALYQHFFSESWMADDTLGWHWPPDWSCQPQQSCKRFAQNWQRKEGRYTARRLISLSQETQLRFAKVALEKCLLDLS